MKFFTRQSFEINGKVYFFNRAHEEEDSLAENAYFKALVGDGLIQIIEGPAVAESEKIDDSTEQIEEIDLFAEESKNKIRKNSGKK